jgi:hypothetical protein
LESSCELIHFGVSLYAAIRIAIGTLHGPNSPFAPAIQFICVHLWNARIDSLRAFHGDSLSKYNHSVHCISCHYDLQNLPEHRCPECGCPFDPSNPNSYFDPVKEVLPLGPIVGALGACYVVNVILCVLIFAGTGSFIGVMLGTLIGALFMLPMTFTVGVFLYALFCLIAKSIASADS